MNKSSKLQEFQKNLMTGISYMMPVIVIAGVTLGITSLLGQQLFGVNIGSKELLEEAKGFEYLLAWLNQVAGKGMMSFMYPVMAGYIAMAIADRPGLAPGMLGGYLAVKLNAGFIGAIIYSNIILKIILIQAIIGYFSTQLRQALKIKLNNMVRH